MIPPRHGLEHMNAVAQGTACITWQTKCSREKMLRLKAVEDKRPRSVNTADTMALNLQFEKKLETF